MASLGRWPPCSVGTPRNVSQATMVNTNDHGILLVKAGQYGARAFMITGINSPVISPDWSLITFSAGEQWGPGTIARELAARGITEDEALDAHDFTFSLLSDVVTTETSGRRETSRFYSQRALSSSNAVGHSRSVATHTTLRMMRA